MPIAASGVALYSERQHAARPITAKTDVLIHQIPENTTNNKANTARVLSAKENKMHLFSKYNMHHFHGIDQTGV